MNVETQIPLELQTTIDFPIHLAYKTDQFEALVSHFNNETTHCILDDTQLKYTS